MFGKREFLYPWRMGKITSNVEEVILQCGLMSRINEITNSESVVIRIYLTTSTCLQITNFYIDNVQGVLENPLPTSLNDIFLLVHMINIKLTQDQFPYPIWIPISLRFISTETAPFMLVVISSRFTWFHTKASVAPFTNMGWL